MKNTNEQSKTGSSKEKSDNASTKPRDGKMPDKNGTRSKDDKKHTTVLGKVNDE